jgi:hypothetical protein
MTEVSPFGLPVVLVEMSFALGVVTLEVKTSFVGLVSWVDRLVLVLMKATS